MMSPKAQVQAIGEREWRKLVGMYDTIEDFDPMALVGRERFH